MRTSFEGLRVVLFGADKNCTDPVKRLLIRHGLLVSTVESPKQVLKVVKNNRMNLIIVDHDSATQMEQLMNRIRFLKTASARRIPAILLGRQWSDELPDTCLKCGFQAYVEKPVSSDELLLTIDKVVPQPDPATGRVGVSQICNING